MYDENNVANELTTGFIELTFRDEYGNLTIPSSLTWRVDDVRSKTNIIPDTTVTPTGSTYVIVIPSANMNILTSTDEWEERVVTISYTYNGTSVATGAFYFGLRNLSFLG